jgi:hypothetical protein
MSQERLHEFQTAGLFVHQRRHGMPEQVEPRRASHPRNTRALKGRVEHALAEDIRIDRVSHRIAEHHVVRCSIRRQRAVPPEGSVQHVVLSLAFSAITGVIGLHTWPFPA